MTTEREALDAAMTAVGKTPGEVRALCVQMFGTPKWGALNSGQQWTLVATIDPNAMGPYGHSMAPFE